MKQFKRFLPFFFAILLLSVSIFIPFLFSAIQDKALLHGVKTEHVSTKAEKDSKQVDISILDRLELIQDNNATSIVSSMFSTKNGSAEKSEITQVLKEVKKLQERNGFPELDLYKSRKYGNDVFQKTVFLSEDKWAVSIYTVTFTTPDGVATVWADADTDTIYQYSVDFTAKSVAMDNKMFAKIFSDYLSITEEAFWSHYSFINDGTMIKLQLNQH